MSHSKCRSRIFLYCSSSIGKKQIISVTGLILILFVVTHLMGNLTFYFGSECFNAYAHKLANLRPFLNVFEYGLLFLFVVHLFFTFQIIWRSIKERQCCSRYSVSPSVQKPSCSSRLMKFTGPIILVYIIMHLLDYTFADQQGAKTLINGESQGLYGLVFNSFLSLPHCLWYIFAMLAVGLHLDHGFQSVFQTFGLATRGNLACIRRLSRVFAIVVTVGYVSIPLYVYVLNKVFF